MTDWADERTERIMDEWGASAIDGVLESLISEALRRAFSCGVAGIKADGYSLHESEIGRLLAEQDQLRAENAKLKSDMDAYMRDYKSLYQQSADMEIENARLREALEHLTDAAKSFGNASVMGKPHEARVACIRTSEAITKAKAALEGK